MKGSHQQLYARASSALEYLEMRDGRYPFQPFSPEVSFSKLQYLNCQYLRNPQALALMAAIFERAPHLARVDIHGPLTQASAAIVRQCLQGVRASLTHLNIGFVGSANVAGTAVIISLAQLLNLTSLVVMTAGGILSPYLPPGLRSLTICLSCPRTELTESSQLLDNLATMLPDISWQPNLTRLHLPYIASPTETDLRNKSVIFKLCKARGITVD